MPLLKSPVVQKITGCLPGISSGVALVDFWMLSGGLVGRDMGDRDGKRDIDKTAHPA